MVLWFMTNEGFDTHLEAYTSMTETTSDEFGEYDFVSCLEFGVDIYVGF